jgi:hypothetical protein
MPPRAVALVILAWLASTDAPAARAQGAQPAADGDPRYSLRLEVGPEHDTNPARLEAVAGAARPDIRSSPLVRAQAAFDLGAAIAARQSVSVSAGLASKVFLSGPARAEDVLVAQAGAGWTFALLPATAFGVAGAYYDAFQRGGTGTRDDPRDFRSVSPAGRLDQGLAGGRLGVGGGWRVFEYKPHPDFGFSAPTAFASFRRAHLAALGEEAADWEWGLAASLELRRFVGARCESVARCPPANPAERQPWRDRFVVLGADVTRTAGFLAGVGLAVHVNDSNSFAQSLVRYAGHARAVLPLPGEVLLSARAEVVATKYDEGVPLNLDTAGKVLASIEDEGRSTLRVELARPVGDRFELGLRYTFYTSPFGDESVTFSRHTALLFGAYVLDR